MKRGGDLTSKLSKKAGCTKFLSLTSCPGVEYITEGSREIERYSITVLYKTDPATIYINLGFFLEFMAIGNTK